ncbi:hypothetical protein F4776DRAFT_150144 [Hypoxylon sp. NC0597]|nr:hypothetical protein F4776DRAFT_150144 [Hypoxylon sp. NC0597]
MLMRQKALIHTYVLTCMALCSCISSTCEVAVTPYTSVYIQCCIFPFCRHRVPYVQIQAHASILHILFSHYITIPNRHFEPFPLRYQTFHFSNYILENKRKVDIDPRIFPRVS